MNEDTFFRALIAALRLAGRDFVETRDDEQHRRFAQVVQRIDELVAEQAPGSEALPQLFVPSPVTNRYPEFDDALLEAQRGLTGSRNPFYPGADLVLSPDYAAAELADLGPTVRALVEQLAEVFIAAQVERRALA
jgi:hypothetical protein